MAFLLTIVGSVNAIAQTNLSESESCYREILDSEDSDTASIIFYNQPSSDKFKKCGPFNKQAFSNIVKSAFYSEALMFQRDSESYALELTERYNRYSGQSNLLPIPSVSMDTWFTLGDSLGYALALNVNTSNVVHNEHLIDSLHLSLQKMNAKSHLADEVKIEFLFQYLNSYNLKTCLQTNVCDRVFYSLMSYLNDNPMLKAELLEKLRFGRASNDFLVNILERGYQNALQSERLKQLESNKKQASNFDFVKNNKVKNRASSCDIKKELSLYLKAEKYCESQVTIANYFFDYNSSATTEIFRDKNRCNSNQNSDH